MKKPIVLTIIDGLGISQETHGNAWANAKTPTLDDLMANYPNSVLKASGEEVGLPAGQMGNSEVGHLNIGAGQIVYTGLSLIAKSIRDGEFASNAAFVKSINHAKENNSTLHVMGLLSHGGVHSLEAHLYEIIEMLKAANVKNVSVHVFTDGRDVAPRSVVPSLVALKNKLSEYNYNLASVQGRLFAMDRDARFEKTETAFEAICGRANNKFTDAVEYIEKQYSEKNLNDEFIEPGILETSDDIFLKNNDSVIFFNFRPDRARQLAHLIVGSKLFTEKPKHPVKNVQLTTMMRYEGITKADVAFDSMEVKNTLGKIISEANLTQLRIAETQKYAHVTFFMDGGIDVEYKGADRILVPSLKIDNFADAPEMSAKEITDKLIASLSKYDLVIMNYANPDMVGHTGDLKAAINAVEIIDGEISRLKKAVDALGGTMFITADHGNAEIMLDHDDKPATKHTSSDVPFITTDKDLILENGALANIAPTILDYLGLHKPDSMDHQSLIKK